MGKARGETMPETYQTLLRPGRAEIIEKKSKFIAIARPVADEPAARAFLEEERKKYWDATHHVWAYQLGSRHETTRYSDDGEPPGTAGLPVLSVLKGEDLQNVMVVVTRYFGGTLLGAGGLVRAYRKAARAAVDSSGIARMTRYIQYRLQVDYPVSGRLQYAFEQMGIILADLQYTDKVTFFLYVEGAKEKEFLEVIREVASGQVVPASEGETFGAFLGGRLVLPD